MEVWVRMIKPAVAGDVCPADESPIGRPISGSTPLSYSHRLGSPRIFTAVFVPKTAVQTRWTGSPDSIQSDQAWTTVPGAYLRKPLTDVLRVNVGLEPACPGAEQGPVASTFASWFPHSR